MSVSFAPAAKLALFDALAAATFTDPQPGVWHSDPSVDHNYHDNIVVGPGDRPLTASQDWLAFGTRDEDVEIPVLVQVFREGTDQLAAEARAWELAGVTATVLAARPFAHTLTAPEVIYSAKPDGFEQTTEAFADGRLVRINFTVHCSGRVAGI